MELYSFLYKLKYKVGGDILYGLGRYATWYGDIENLLWAVTDVDIAGTVTDGLLKQFYIARDVDTVQKILDPAPHKSRLLIRSTNKLIKLQCNGNKNLRKLGHD